MKPLRTVLVGGAVLGWLVARAAAPPGAPMGAAFGINEPLNLPASMSTRKLDPAAERKFLDEAAARAKGLGAAVVRLDTAGYPGLSMWGMQREQWSFERADQSIEALQDQDLDIVVVLGPWPSRGAALYTDAYLPADNEQYVNYVRQVVERYNGDGLKDKRGLRRGVVAWEIDSEPDLNNSVKPEGMKGKLDPSKFETAAEYARLVLTTAGAIRMVDSQATIVLGSMAAPLSGPGRKYLDEVVATPGVLDAVDVLGLQLYTDAEDTRDLAATLQVAAEVAPGKQVWLTRVGVPSSGKARYISRGWQGAMLSRLYVEALHAGVERVFWHGLADPESPDPGSPEGRHGTDGLMAWSERGGRALEDKPAGRSYRGFAQTLGPWRADQVSDVPSEGGKVLKVSANWLAWEGKPVPPYQAACSIDLLSGELTVPSGPVRAPALLMGVEGCKAAQR